MVAGKSKNFYDAAEARQTSAKDTSDTDDGNQKQQPRASRAPAPSNVTFNQASMKPKTQSQASMPRMKIPANPSAISLARPKTNACVVANRILSLEPQHISMVRGPFHNQIRASSYGDVYDEIPWRVMVGLDLNKGRDPIDQSIQKCAYKNEVLIQNCHEERRDRQYIRNHRTPISQYSHMYTTTYGDSFGKRRVCNKERAFLRTLKGYPLSAAPAYQPELNVDMLRHCVRKPAECVYTDAKEAYDKEMARLKRYEDAAGPPKAFKYNTKDLAKCKHWP